MIVIKKHPRPDALIRQLMSPNFVALQPQLFAKIYANRNKLQLINAQAILKGPNVLPAATIKQSVNVSWLISALVIRKELSAQPIIRTCVNAKTSNVKVILITLVNTAMILRIVLVRSLAEEKSLLLAPMDLVLILVHANLLL